MVNDMSHKCEYRWMEEGFEEEVAGNGETERLKGEGMAGEKGKWVSLIDS